MQSAGLGRIAPSPFLCLGASRVDSILRNLEQERELRWSRQARAVELKLRWRALFIEKYLHILPSERILEVAAGGGALTEPLSRVLRGQNPITALTFSPELLAKARSKNIPNATFLPGLEFLENPPEEKFDFVVGSSTLWQPGFSTLLRAIERMLQPGGRILFFEPNLRFPARLFNEMRTRRGNTEFPATPEDVTEELARLGWNEIHLSPHDIVSCRLGYERMRYLDAKAILLEHAPALRLACASMYLSARKPGPERRPRPNLAADERLRHAVSVVVPAHNEAPNIGPLVDALVAYYGEYIHEIIIVNDNSTDRTAEAAAEAEAREHRVTVINRSSPNGVGRALKDGYRAATGKYILSMDCDFIEILPELRGLFEAVGQGHAGAIGSRFTHESVLINYPFRKMLLNRVCHALIKLFLFGRVRDITNNLKLYRADILKQLDLESPGFSANLETGLKPLLAGHDITEVATSWIDRRPQMGASTFYIRKAGAAYVTILYRCWRKSHGGSHGAAVTAIRAALSKMAQAVRRWQIEE